MLQTTCQEVYLLRVYFFFYKPRREFKTKAKERVVVVFSKKKMQGLKKWLNYLGECSGDTSFEFYTGFFRFN